MATFSSKQISDVYESLLHMDDTSNNAVGMDGANVREMRTGDNDTTGMWFTTSQISQGKKLGTSGVPTNAGLAVVTSAGNGNAVWGGSLTLCNNDAGGYEGGQINIKDNQATDIDCNQTYGYAIDNYKTAGVNQLRTLYTGASGTSVQSQVIQQKDTGEMATGINQSWANEALEVSGKLKINGPAGTKIIDGGQTTTIYVNANTTNTTNGPTGDDSHPGTENYPVASLSRAISMCSPSGNNTIKLYPGVSGSTNTYKITNHWFEGHWNMDIRTINIDGTSVAWGDNPEPNMIYTFLEQGTTNEWTGVVNNESQWVFYGSMNIKIGGLTLKVSYPQAGAGNHSNWKMPFKAVLGHSCLRLGLGLENSPDTTINFVNANTEINGSTKAFHNTCLVIIEKQSNLNMSVMNSKIVLGAELLTNENDFIQCNYMVGTVTSRGHFLQSGNIIPNVNAGSTDIEILQNQITMGAYNMESNWNYPSVYTP